MDDHAKRREPFISSVKLIVSSRPILGSDANNEPHIVDDALQSGNRQRRGGNKARVGDGGGGGEGRRCPPLSAARRASRGELNCRHWGEHKRARHGGAETLHNMMVFAPPQCFSCSLLINVGISIAAIGSGGDCGVQN